MRFGQFFGHETIPEWKECYLSYLKLKEIIELIKQLAGMMRTLLQLRRQNDQGVSLPQPIENVFGALIHEQFQVNSDIPEILSLYHGQPKKSNHPNESQSFLFDHSQFTQLTSLCQQRINEINQVFFLFYRSDSEIIELFYQMKVLSMYSDCLPTLQMAKQQLEPEKQHKLLSLIQYLYIEMVYINEMRISNVEASRKILKKHKKNGRGFIFTPKLEYKKIQRLSQTEAKYIQKLEEAYVLKSGEKDSRAYLRSTSKRAGISATDAFMAGSWLGISVAGLCVLVFIIVYSGLSIEAVSVFSRDFPTWRGSALFISYIWILCFNLYVFEKYKINHSLIFYFNDHHKSTSAQLFRLAGSLSSLFLLLFLLYLLSVGLGLLAWIRPYYLAAAVWAVLLVYLLNPLPVGNRTGRLFALRLVLKTFASPVVGVSFPIVWATDQFISLATPLRDLVYTLCYYRELDLDDVANPNTCANSRNFALIAVVSLVPFALRVLQCVRLSWQEGGRYLGSKHFVNSLKYVTSMVAVLFAFYYKQNSTLLGPWALFLVLATFFSYLWDLKMDWQLLEPNPKHTLLRCYLTFGTTTYYLLMAANFLLRCAWILTVAPNVIDSALLGLVTAFLEIFRRGAWNILRVEKEHISNCAGFKALPDLTELKAQLWDHPKPLDQLHQSRNLRFFRLLTARLAQKQTKLYKYDDSYFHLQKAQIALLEQRIQLFQKSCVKSPK